MFGTPEAGYIGLAYAHPAAIRGDNLVDVGVITAAGEEILPLQSTLLHAAQSGVHTSAVNVVGANASGGFG